MYTISALYDLSHTMAADYLRRFSYPWEALGGIKDLIVTLGASLPQSEYSEAAPQVWVHKTATIAPTAFLGAPCIIGANTEVRHGAFIRGSALVGENCVVGNSVELKNVILFDGVQGKMSFSLTACRFLTSTMRATAFSVTRRTWAPVL